MLSTRLIPNAARKFVVLVVEDDDDVRDAVSEQLSADGYHVLAVGDGQRALSLLAQITPHVIMLDLMLPEVSGWEVLAELGADPMLAEIPVVIMSAYADQAPRDVAGVLKKPMGVNELRDAVRRVCG
jgi:CheY-like chemotaxis protein